MRVWDVASGQCMTTLEGHTDNVLSVSFSPDGKQVASGSEDKSVRVWDVVSGQCMTTLEGYTDTVTSVSFSSDGKQVASK